MQQLKTHSQTREFKTVHFFGGIGGCTLGMLQSESEYKGVTGKFRPLFSVDVDKGACEAYEYLTGSKAVCRDMFDREQYILFNGTEPAADWREVMPEDLREWAGGEYPDVVIITAPCKGFSRLLPNAAAQKPKYRALNKLALRAITLTLEAWGDDPPAAILFENVPGIETRGKRFLEEIRALLSGFGYLFHEGHHDCGEIGQLGQKRIRYLMIARNPKKLPSFIYQPPKFKHKTIGDILGPLPMPGDTERGGKMHRIPNLAWRTWERLALIPAGKDWRALKDLNHTPQNGTFRIVPWDGTASTVTTESTAPGNASSISVADPRTGNLQIGKFANVLRVVPWHEPSATIAGGNGVMQGGLCVADQRQRWNGCYKVVNWDETSPTATGQPDVQNSAISVADPRIGWGGYRITDWEDASPSVTGRQGVNNTAISVQDPRISEKWSGAGNFKIMPWGEPSNAMTASSDVHAGAAAVADPRIPEPNARGVWIIVAIDGTWHRPITTFEMAMLQGFPQLVNGKPLELPGNSDAKWREWIGNAVPVQSATAIGNALLATMMPNYEGDWYFDIDWNDIWVQPVRERVTA